MPFRFAATRGQARGQLADLLEQAALLAGKDTEDAGRDRHCALDAPLLVALIARIDPGHPVATLHEQWMAVGGALTNLLKAAHTLGYAGRMLSGSKVRAAPVVAALCEPGEQLVGWVMGTAQRPGTPKFQTPAPDALMRDWP
ncbi:MAG: nitroreductase [Pseudomonadota bacterium]